MEFVDSQVPKCEGPGASGDTDIDQAKLIKMAMSRRNKPLKSWTIVNRNATKTYFEKLRCLFCVDSHILHIHNKGFVDFATSR
jgi:hypothetical protein